MTPSPDNSSGPPASSPVSTPFALYALRRTEAVQRRSWPRVTSFTFILCPTAIPDFAFGA